MQNVASFSDGEDSDGEDLMENMQKYYVDYADYKL